MNDIKKEIFTQKCTHPSIPLIGWNVKPGDEVEIVTLRTVDSNGRTDENYETFKFDGINATPAKGNSNASFRSKEKAAKFVTNAGDDYKNLANAMNFYLLIAIIRNHMSHSSDFTTDDEDICEGCMTRLGIKPCADGEKIFSYNTVKEILRLSIEDFKRAEKETGELINTASWEKLFKTN